MMPDSLTELNRMTRILKCILLVYLIMKHVYLITRIIIQSSVFCETLLYFEKDQAEGK